MILRSMFQFHLCYELQWDLILNTASLIFIKLQILTLPPLYIFHQLLEIHKTKNAN